VSQNRKQFGNIRSLRAGLIGSGRSALTPREIVESALPLANYGPSLTEIERLKEFLGPCSSVSGASRPRSPSARDWWRNTEDFSEWFRSVLKSIVADRERARTELQEEVRAGLEYVHVDAKLSWDGRRSRTDLIYTWRYLEGLAAIVLMWLLEDTDDRMSLGNLLRECKYKDCGRLFLSSAPPGGGPIRAYCKATHRVRAMEATGAERTRRWRERKARRAK
jgi:hypothetical protein